MLCANCFEKDIESSNTIKKDDFIIRTKCCKKCGYKFLTIEVDLDMYDSIINSADKLNDKINSVLGKRTSISGRSCKLTKADLNRNNETSLKKQEVAENDE